MAGKEVTIYGKEYENLRKASVILKFDYEKVRKKAARDTHLSLEEVIEFINKGLKSTSVVYKGEVFPDLRNFCKEYNLSYSYMSTKRREGYGLEESIRMCRDFTSKNEVPVGGKVFKNLSEACRYYKKDEKLVRGRLKQGWKLEEALELVYREKRNDIEFEGVIYSDSKELCEKYGVNYNTFNTRKAYGWSLYECIYGKPFMLNGVQYLHRLDACNKLGYTEKTIRGRISRGYTLEEAFGVHPYCIDGRIVTDVSSKVKKVFPISSSVKALSYVTNNYYKCNDGGKIKYYSKDELFEIRRKAFEAGERF